METSRGETDLPDHPTASKKAVGWLGTRLHAGHFAFMRAVVQGLDTRQSWDRYLRLEGEHDDIRHVRRTIQRIRDEFASAARRHARHGVARLIRIDADRLEDGPRKLPTLEEFAVEHGLEDFSQAEQLDYYREHYGGAPTGASRRRRVIGRQLEALRWLEELVAVPPRPSDPPSFWIHPDIATRLEAAGVATLEALIYRINGIGYRWWAGIAGIGVGKAERIVAWLRAQEATLGLALGAHVDRPRREATEADLQALVKRGTSVVPIEKFVPPAGLSGADGRFRAAKETCRIAADSDVGAVMAWVESKQANPNTRRAYLKEGERFLLWSVLERGKALSSLDTEDCLAYLEFIADPQPAAVWCGKRGREKWSPLWRPFEGPLSGAASRHAVVVLKNLFGYLVSHGYLIRSPWQDITLPHASKSRRQKLTAPHWRQIERFGATLAPTSANARLLFALHLIRTTGLRLSEAVSARVDDLCGENGRIHLRVRGRAGKERQLPLAPALLVQLSAYLQSRGLNPDPLHGDNRGAHLLGQALDLGEHAPRALQRLRTPDNRAGIATGTLHDQFKSFFADCARHAANACTEEREALRMASADWLRDSSSATTALG